VRNEKSFKKLYDEVMLFGNGIGIDMNEPARIRRQQTIPSRFKNYIVTASFDHRN
jgi:hypothetical protein